MAKAKIADVEPRAARARRVLFIVSARGAAPGLRWIPNQLALWPPRGGDAAHVVLYKIGISRDRERDREREDDPARQGKRGAAVRLDAGSGVRACATHAGG
jgi:hypothetical protein